MNMMRAEAIEWLDENLWDLGITLKAPIRQLPVYSKPATTQTSSTKHTRYKDTAGIG